MKPLLQDLIQSSEFVSDFNREIDELGFSAVDPKLYLQMVTDHINTLSCITVYYDAVTANHQLECENIASSIAKQMDFKAFDLVGVMLGSQSHDIGKITLYKDLITKPGKLTDPEYEIIKTHTIVGQAILSHFKTPWDLAKYAFTHHERLDGSGYPSGLKGDEIPLDERIIHIADVVDALRSCRPYRTPWNMQQIIDFLYSEEGKYDTEIIKQFELISDKITYNTLDHA